MSKKIIRGFRTNMTLYSLCLIAFVAVTVPFQPLLAAAEGLVALLVILVGRRRNKMAQASVRQYMDRVSGGMDTARSSNMLYAPLPMLGVRCSHRRDPVVQRYVHGPDRPEG